MIGVGQPVSMIRGVRIAGPGREFLMDDEPVDIHIRGGKIVDIAPTGALRAQGDVLDASGAWTVPGLWDNHVHTVQWALSSEREPLDDTMTAAEAAARMSTVAPLHDGRRVGSGYRDALWPDSPSLALLDRMTGVVATYLINADVHSVWLNSAALRREGFAADDGVLREEDAFEVCRRLNAVEAGHGDRAIRSAGERAARRGVTGLVDFDMAWNAEAWPRRVASGFAAHRVEFAVYPFDLERAIAAGLRTGELLNDVDPTGESRGLVRMGPLKIITDGSLGTRTAACSHAYAGGEGGHGMLNVRPEDLHTLLMRAAGAGLDVALHAIGDRATTAALDAITATGASGTIEHAQLVRHADLARFARLGVVASVQPQHALDDRELANRLWADQTSIGYPLASLRDAGVELRFGSDAPVAALDPWQAIAAAVTRTDDERDAWHPEERLSVDDALSASVRSALRPGDVADIVVCAENPLTASGDRLRGMPVVATLVGGRLTHES